MTSLPMNPGFCMLEVRRFLFGLVDGVDAWAETRRASRHVRMQRTLSSTWPRELSDQLSEQEAHTLRAFCESDVGRKMIAATAAGNQAVTRMLNERADDHINEAYQKLLQEAEAVQQKHMGAERTPGR